MNQIIELLEWIFKIADSDEPDEGHGYPLIKILANEALDLLKQQPTAGEFTKETRINFTTHFENPDWVIHKKLMEACDRLDRAEARSIDNPNRPASKTEVEMAKRLCNYQDEVHELKRRLDRAESINADLLEACGPFARLADMIPKPDAPDAQWNKFNTAIRALPLDRYREARTAIAKAKQGGE